MLCSLIADGCAYLGLLFVKKNISYLNLVKIFTHKSHNRSNRRPSSPANGPQRLPSYLPKCAAPISRPFCHLTGVFNFNISLFYFRMLTRLWYPTPPQHDLRLTFCSPFQMKRSRLLALGGVLFLFTTVLLWSHVHKQEVCELQIVP